MKTFTPPRGILAILFLALSCLFATPMKAQTIQIDSIFSADGEIFPFSPNDTIYGLSISGSVHLFSDTSLVRVILSDNAGNEWMVYESYPFINPHWDGNISGIGDETMYRQIINPHSLNIQVMGATLSIDSLMLQNHYTENLENLQETYKNYIENCKVDSINAFIDLNQMLWVAYRTSMSDLSYTDKRNSFGEKYNLLGLDFYVGGLYDPIPGAEGTVDTSLLVDSWDWRNRHGANDPLSPYYDNEAGWLTPVEDQAEIPSCKGLCYIYGPLAAIEGVANLYFNWHVDYDLSEQHVLNCDGWSADDECDKGPSYSTGNFARETGVVDESCYQRDSLVDECRQESPPQGNPSYQLKIANRFAIYPFNSEVLKDSLIIHGPMQISIKSYLNDPMEHIMALVGYGKLKAGDFFHVSHPYYDSVYVDSSSNYIGELYWIFKNSWGYNWGDNGYFYHLAEGLPFRAPTYFGLPFDDLLTVSDTIIPRDADHDGYWNWGLSADYDLPESYCSAYKDSDDSRNRIGPLDSNYYGIPVMPDFLLTRGYLFNSDTINNGDNYYFTGDTSQDIDLHFVISNAGTAQFNLKKYLLTSQGFVTKIYENHPGMYELTRPDTNIVCSNGGTLPFEITLNHGAEPGTLAVVNIHLYEPDFDSIFAFTLVFNGCETASGYDSITTAVLWGDTCRTRQKDLHIQAGGELTITGKVMLSPETDIIVEPGGRLIIDGGTLTRSCENELWNGIQVWGDSSLSQYPDSNQGYLNIINNGCIEYAHTGVFVGKIDSHDTLFAFSGGIIIADSALFRNNEVDVEFLPFINDLPYPPHGEMYNMSSFRKCTFLTCDPQFIIQKPDAHVILDGVNGVDFSACTFALQEFPGHLFDEDDKGTGILAFDAQVDVRGSCPTATLPCQQYDSCHFNNLRYGIKAVNTGGNRPFRVSESVFDNSIAGIYLSGYHLPMVVSSTFNTCTDQPIPDVGDAFVGGLYLDGSTGYQVENNYFTGPLTAIPDSGSIATIGIYVKNSGEDDNEIYNNYFTGLDAGIIAEGINKGEKSGLCLKCNDFRTCLNDLLVFEGGSAGRFIGINENQGAEDTLSSTLAGNTFTLEVQHQQAVDNGGNRKYYWSYFNDADHFNYYHHAYDPDIVTFPWDSINYSNKKVHLVNQFIPYVKEEACPSGIGIPALKTYQDPWLSKYEAEIQLSYLENELYSLLDGGDTEGLDFEIITSMPDEALELRDQLLYDSPYLSDSILKQAIYKENVLPNAMIRDVLTANPQSAKSGEILDAVDSRYDPMPDYMMAEIMQGLDQIGALESLESKIGYWKQYRSRAVNRIIRGYLADSSLVGRQDSIIALYQDESNLQSKYRLAFAYWENNQAEQALNTLSDISSDFELSSREQETHQQYLDYFDILQTMMDSNLNVRQLDSTSIQHLINIMNTDLPLISAYARGMLINERHLNYTESVSFPTQVKSSPDYYSIDQRKTKISEEDHLILFPNPCGDFVVAYFNTIEEGHLGRLMLSDIQGKELEKIGLNSLQNQIIVNLSNFPNGIYVLSLIIDNNPVSSKLLSKARK